MQFDWDWGNVDHLARHRVLTVEAEEAILDRLGQILDYEFVDEEHRYRHIGATLKGRLLIVLYTIRDEAIRPITAFDAPRNIAQAYRQGEK